MSYEPRWLTDLAFVSRHRALYASEDRLLFAYIRELRAALKDATEEYRAFGRDEGYGTDDENSRRWAALLARQEPTDKDEGSDISSRKTKDGLFR